MMGPILPAYLWALHPHPLNGFSGTVSFAKILARVFFSASVEDTEVLPIMKRLHTTATTALLLLLVTAGMADFDSLAGSSSSIGGLYPRSDIVFTTDGTCGDDWVGAGKGMHCPLTGSNLCCSYKGWCGDTDRHCVNGCQAAFGQCAEDATRYPRPTECGPAHNNTRCEGGDCCSTSGYCGTGEKYCKSPDCLLEFGMCDATLLVPAGENTTDVDRRGWGTLGSSVVYGEGIYHCEQPGTVALTFVSCGLAGKRRN
jgi:hypothetical protein